MVLVTSHGFRGAYVGSRHSMSAVAIAGEGTGMERDYDFSSALHAGDLEATGEDRPQSRASARCKRLNPRKVETRRVPVVFDPRIAGSLVGHLASAINGASIARKTSFLKDRMGERLFRSGIRIVDDPLRRRGLRSQPVRRRRRCGQAARRDRGRRAEILVSRLGDRARIVARDHRPRVARRFVVALPFADQPASRSRRAKPAGTDRRRSRTASTSPT